jgi:hypothetical protein
MVVENVSGDMESVDNIYLMTWSDNHTVLLNMTTHQQYDLVQNLRRGLRGLGNYLISSDGHVLAAPYQNPVQLFDLDGSRVLDYAPLGQTGDATVTWTPDSKRAAVLYKTSTATPDYGLDVISEDGTLLQHVNLPAAMQRVPLDQFQEWWSHLYWTSCGG